MRLFEEWEKRKIDKIMKSQNWIIQNSNKTGVLVVMSRDIEYIERYLDEQTLSEMSG